MAEFTQSNSLLRISTPLGTDAILLIGVRGTETISELFIFQLELISPLDAPVDFSNILGQPALIEFDFAPGDTRFFHGIISRFSQGRRDRRFIHYRAELVPLLWILTRREQSRIFQHQTVKQILKTVLDGIMLKWTTMGNFAERDYCTQYRETDYEFAKRLMEEEGIYYYFDHSADGHTLILADTPQGHADIPGPKKIAFREEEEGSYAVTTWEKSQEIRTGKFTLWDHNFELPHEHLDAEKEIASDVTVGTVVHKLVVGPTAQLENYSYPGGYADWFDGIDRGGAEQAADLQHVFEQNSRLVQIRAQGEAASAVRIHGTSNCGNLTSGHKFSIEEHYDADGDYVLLQVTHDIASSGNYASGDPIKMHYSNTFECLPAALTFRPERKTPRPTVRGTQTAVVVGPAGEEIFTDKYGRVKVQFHWDRAGKRNADSSCWVRVATIWAGKGWGVIHIPRIGHEVVVDFLEGNPDRPIIIGSVYNADHMPPGELPKEAMVSGLASRSTPKAGPNNFNGMRANDTKGKEHLTVQAEYDQTSLVKHDEDHTVKNNRTIKVDGTHSEIVKGDTSITVTKGTFSHDVQTGTALYHVKGAVEHIFDATSMTTVTAAVTEHYNDSQETIVKNGIHIASETAHIYVHTATSIQLHVGESSIWMDSGGQISLKGNNIAINGKESVSISGGIVRMKADTSHEIESGGNAKSEAKATNTVKGAMVMLNP